MQGAPSQWRPRERDDGWAALGENWLEEERGEGCNKVEECVGRESNPGRMRGRHAWEAYMLPLHYQRSPHLSPRVHLHVIQRCFESCHACPPPRTPTSPPTTQWWAHFIQGAAGHPSPHPPPRGGRGVGHQPSCPGAHGTPSPPHWHGGSIDATIGLVSCNSTTLCPLWA